MTFSTLSEILASSARTGAAGLSVRSPDGWSSPKLEPAATARWLAAALLGYGLEPGSRVAVLGTEGNDALVAQLAALVAGAVLVPLDPRAADEDLRDGLMRTGASRAIASDERQLARLLAWRPELPELTQLLLMRAEPSERRPAALVAESAIEIGRERLVDDPDLLRRAIAAGDERAPAILFPEHADGDRAIHRSDLTNLAGRIAETLSLTSGTPVLVALPVSSLARLAAVLAAIGSGAVLCLAAPEERLDVGLDRLGPGAALADAGAIVRFHEAWNADIDASGWIARTTTRWALRRGAATERSSWAHRVAEVLALRRLRSHLGGRLDRMHVVGPPIHPEIASFFTSIGVPLRPFEVRLAR